MRKFLAPAVAAGVFTASSALAAPFTTNSPVGGDLPTGITEVGGIVFDAIGSSGTRVTSQLSADSLFAGSQNGNTNLEIGRQAGYDDGILGALGGGIMQLAIRVTLFDGDNADGDFDDDDNFLAINGIEIGNFSDIETISTDDMGVEIAGDNTTGFADEELDTGFFVVTDAAILAAIFASVADTGELIFTLVDRDNDLNQFYDFSEGINGSLIGVGSGPVVTPVPVPMAALLFAPAIGALGVARRRKKV